MAKNTLIIRTVKGQSKSVIWRNGCDQKGSRLSGETEVKQMSFQVFDEVTISYFDGEVQNRALAIERI